MRVLIVEDDQLLGSGLQLGLHQEACATELLRNADAAARALQEGHFDVMILDLGLPGRDGLSLLRELRLAGSRLPVLILTARDALEDRVAGLDAGADDYLIKPFDLLELVARLRALFRRSQGRAVTVLRAGTLALDLTQRTATFQEQRLALSPTEFALLETLMSEADRVVRRARLQSSTYGWANDVDSNALEVHIHNLRRKLGKNRILTIRGIGYQLVSEPQS